MTTTVVGSILEKTSSMGHLLDLIPNVSARNGEIIVFRRGNPDIYINELRLSIDYCDSTIEGGILRQIKLGKLIIFAPDCNQSRIGYKQRG